MTSGWFRRWFAARGKPSFRKGATRITPGVEALEARTVPATTNVNTTVDAVALNPNVSAAINGSGDVSLRSAIQFADAQGGTQLINLPAAGVPYLLNLTGTNDDQSLSGDLDIFNPGAGPALDLTIQGGGAATTVIDGNLTDRVFEIFAGTTVSISGVTIQNGRAPAGDTNLGGSPDSFGGGILTLGNLTVSNNVITGNQATGRNDGFVFLNGVAGGTARGGGIYNGNGSLTVTNSTLSSNRATAGSGTDNGGSSNVGFGGTAQGGGVFNDGGALQVTDTTLDSNRATGGDGTSTNGFGDGGLGEGGGLFTRFGVVTLRRNTFVGNQAAGGVGTSVNGIQQAVGGKGEGGGLATEGDSLTIENNTFSGNQAIGGAGAGAGTQAGSGSGVANQGGDGQGGGIFAGASEDPLVNSTLTLNQAIGGNAEIGGNGQGGGIFVDPFATTFQIGSTIVAANTVTAGTGTTANGTPTGPDVFGPFVTLGNNLIGTTDSGSTSFTNNVMGDQVGPINSAPIDPRLGPLANNGGPTQTHALLISGLPSPAIDKGAVFTPAPTTDQRSTGFARTVGPQTDIGAYEVQNGSLAGFVYRDDNNNGVFELGLGEAGIQGVTVTLTGTDFLNNPVNLSVMTDGTGLYTFPSLRPGTYTITETQPGGFLDGKDTQGTPGNGTAANDQFANITVGDGVNGVNNNFGELGPASLSGFVYRDDNNNGVFEPGLGEVAISGVTLTLTGTDDLGNANTTTTTLGTGAYSFANLRPGTYTLTETQPSGFLDGKDTQGTPGNGTVANDQLANITLAAGVNGVNNDFGELPLPPPSPPPPPPPPPPALAQLSGIVFRDDNSDGVFQPQLGEVGLPNVLVSIKAVGDPSVLTAADGSFVFTDLPAGTYDLTVTQSANLLPETPTPGTAGGTVVRTVEITNITLNPGTVAPGYLFPEGLLGPFGNIAGAIITPGIVAPSVPPTLLGKVELLGSSVATGSTGDLQGFTNYVNGLYRDVLGRVPSTSDVNFWVGRLLGGESRKEVAAEVWASPEHRTLQVDRFYQQFLHRDGGDAGRAFWVGVFLSGASETDVAVGFLTSQEYLSRPGGVDTFVASVYRDVLGRIVDPAGRAFWVGGVQAGQFSFADVTRGILTADEASFTLMGLFYGSYLHRPLDAAGAQFWVDELRRDQAPTLVAEQLLASDEYFLLPHGEFVS
ncbi:MAG TPA: SdrD B-like domain-containing protein [Gemmataceae bacterium]|nr:SdrD B-like domain-containing protein [Gemmataceae bacterium]